MKVKCPKCNYEWEYKGNRNYACCPKCYRQFRINKIFNEQSKDYKIQKLSELLEAANKKIFELENKV